MNNIIREKRLSLDARVKILLAFAFLFLSLTAEQCSSSSISVVGPPSISAVKVNSVLCAASSPACGTGQSLYDLSKQYKVDDAIALAFFKHESAYGSLGMARATLSLGNVTCEDGYACYQGFAAFVSWSQGYKAWFVLISGPLYVGSGLTTVDAILHKYDPGSSDNDASYISDVVQSVHQYQS